MTYYPFISSMDEAPIGFFECWNRQALQKAGVRSIVLYSKGGKNPEDTLEKLLLTYSKDWSTLLYKGFKFDETPAIWTNGTVTFVPEKASGEILFTKHFGIDKTSKTSIQKSNEGYRLLRSKANNRFDTAWVIGTLMHPSAVITKIGKTLFSIDMYLEKNSSTQDIVHAFGKLPFDRQSIENVQRTVIFTESGKPTVAFLLGDNYSQVAKTKAWTYRKDHNIASYQEWSGAFITKTMIWEYGTSQFPERLTVNRKTYFYCYQ